MRRNRLLFVLIPVVLILLAVGGIFIYLTINSSPSKLFTKSITKVFDALEINQDKFKSVKGNVELSANIDSKEEEIKEIKDALANSKIVLNSAVDTDNWVFNGNVEAVYNNENLVNGELAFQDDKIYFAFKDWLDKYIEIPIEKEDLEQIKETNSKKVDIDLLLNSVEEELLRVVEKQEFSKEKVTLKLDGRETKVTKSSIELTEEKTVSAIKELVQNLKGNGNFQKSLGELKEKTLEEMDNLLMELPTEDYDQDSTIVFSIYTKGLFNEFVAVEFSTKYLGEVDTGIELVKQNEGKYEFNVYENQENEREYSLRVAIEDKKESNTKGTMTISISSEEESFDFIYKYEVKGNRTVFELSTTIEDTNLTVSGNVIEEGTKNSGSIIISLQVPDYGNVKLNCLYNLEYNAVVNKVDTSKATKIEEMTEEEMEELTTNMQNSKIFSYISENELLDIARSAVQETEGAFLQYDEPNVENEMYKVTYNVSDGFIASKYGSKLDKTYSDSNGNTIAVYIDNNDAETFLGVLDDEYVLTSTYYKNQEITETQPYELNGKTYQYRGISYEDDYGKYLNLYFTYELDGNNTYVVEVKIENNSLSLDSINQFLNIEVTNNINNLLNNSNAIERQLQEIY